MVLPEIAILILPGCSEIKKKIICCLFDYLSIKIVCVLHWIYIFLYLIRLSQLSAPLKDP